MQRQTRACKVAKGPSIYMTHHLGLHAFRVCLHRIAPMQEEFLHLMWSLGGFRAPQHIAEALCFMQFSAEKHWSMLVSDYNTVVECDTLVVHKSHSNGTRLKTNSNQPVSLMLNYTEEPYGEKSFQDLKCHLTFCGAVYKGLRNETYRARWRTASTIFDPSLALVSQKSAL